MPKSHESKQLIAGEQKGLQGHQEYGYGAKSELGVGTQRHEMQDTQSQMAEMQGMIARELPE